MTLQTRAALLRGTTTLLFERSTQSCGLCGAEDVAWCHELDTQKVEFLRYGKGHTLPHCWMTCERCELLYQDRDEDSLIRVMATFDGWPHFTEGDIDEVLRIPLATFRKADLRVRRLYADTD